MIGVRGPNEGVSLASGPELANDLQDGAGTLNLGMPMARGPPIFSEESLLNRAILRRLMGPRDTRTKRLLPLFSADCCILLLNPSIDAPLLFIPCSRT